MIRILRLRATRVPFMQILLRARVARQNALLAILATGCVIFSVVTHAAPQEGYTRIADEGQPFSIKGKQRVRYGAHSTWIEREVSGQAKCTNNYFGQDPIVGVRKRCELATSSKDAPQPPRRTDAKPVLATTIAVAPQQALSSAKPMPPAVAWGTPQDSARFFVSGHSLTDDPYAANIADIALSLIGHQAAKYNQQIGIGSPISLRTGAPKNVAGYSTGKNRPYGEGLDILKEFETGRTINGDLYDTLVITENHNLIQAMQWENTVKQTRHFHEQLIAANPRAKTYLHASWWAIDKNNPATWLDAERALGPMWQCVASRVNWSLAAEERQDRVWPLPASLALVDLVERALNSQVGSVSAGSPKETLDRIFSDNVHLTPLGNYYLSLVSFAAIYQRSPEGAPPPQGVNQDQAAELQSLAWQFTTRFYSKYKDPSMTECNNHWAPPACDRYWSVRNRPNEIRGCQALFQNENKKNPLYYDAQTDASFWFPSKP